MDFSRYWKYFISNLIVLFSRALYGYHYLLLPTPVDLENYYQEILTTNQSVSPGDARKWAKETFNEYLMDGYLKYGTRNTQNNDSKMLNHSRCIGALIISFVLTCAAYAPYYLVELG